jgi:ACT domain-containing protein
MKEFVLQIDVINSNAIVPEVLKKISETKTNISGYTAAVNVINDTYGIITVTIEANTEKVHYLKRLLESFEEIVDVSVSAQKSFISYYKSCNS